MVMLIGTWLPFDEGVEADALDILHYYVHVVVGLNDVVYLEDVVMVDLLQYLDLTAHALSSLDLLYLLLLVYLYSHLLIVGLKDSQPDRSIRSLSNLLTHHKLLLELRSLVDGWVTLDLYQPFILEC